MALTGGNWRYITLCVRVRFSVGVMLRVRGGLRGRVRGMIISYDLILHVLQYAWPG